MNPIRHSRQAARILRGLGDLPGGQEVNLLTRKLPPAMKPAAQGAPPQQELRTFPLDRATDETVPAADDIVITVSGVLPRGEAVDRVLTRARSLLSNAGAQGEWDVRSLVRPRDGGLQAYQITLFTDAPAATQHYA